MKSHKKTIFLSALACMAALGCTTASADVEEPLTRRVVAIQWDGFDPSYLDGRADIPNIERLIREGVLYPALQTAYPSITNTSFSSIVTGAYPDTTGIRAVWWDRARNQSFGQDRIFEAETIVQSLRRGGRSSASIGMWLFIDRGLSADAEDAIYLQPEDEKIQDFGMRVDLALEFLGGERGYVPDFLTVYANTLDSTGHQDGPSSPRVVEALEEMDTHLGRLLAGLEELGQAGETTVMLMGDHGMSNARISIRKEVTDALADRGYRLQWMATSGDKNRSALPETELVAVTYGRHASIFFKGRNQDDEKEQRAFSRKEKKEVIEIIAGVPNVTQVLNRKQLDELRAHPDVGDIVAEARPPHAFLYKTIPENGGGHGSTLEQHFPFILWGEGIREGVRAESGRSVDIAPTIARLLGAPAPELAEGRVLSEALHFPEGEQ